MKIGHVVLFTVAASVLGYLNSALKDEKENKALEELEEFTDEESNKLLNKEDLSEDLNDISESLMSIGKELLDNIFNDDDIDEPIVINKTESEDDLIKDIEDLLASLEGEDYETKEEEYFSELKDAIDNTLVLDNENNPEVMDSSIIDEEVTPDEIDEIFSEILRQENLSSGDIKESSSVEDEYLESLASELKEAIGEDEAKEDEKDLYTKINELYPYLSLNFVRAVYDLKEEIASEYPLDEKIILLHRISFENLEDLRQFTEIVLDHDYRVNVDEGKMIVDVFKIFTNEDGKILTNIFEIANQAKLLNGNYEGYHVEIV